MKATLCIVDMQDHFKACPPIALRVASLAQKAVQRKMGIVVLEYVGCGETNFQVREVLKGYDRVVYVMKCRNDGSAEFLDACVNNGFNVAKVFVCGVFTDQCVSATIGGIRQSSPKSKIAIVARATKASWDSNQ